MKNVKSHKLSFLLGIYLILNFAIYNINIAQSKFDIIIEPLKIDEVGGLQSFAFGQYEGKWLIVGGRLDGLHRRQPFAAFDKAGHNTVLTVIDPIEKSKWSANITDLSKELQDHLKSTNMQFYQIGKYLYLFGGYGFSDIENDHTTFSNLTAIDLPTVIDAIISKKSIISSFRQISDSKFQVTGGRIEKINDVLYLLGGQKFIGRYNPMGPNNGPGFIQEYTNQIRKFKINDDGKTITIEHLQTITDSDNLHRRDFNVTPQIMPNGDEGITAFSGVFQKNINLPYLNCVNIDSLTYEVNNEFTQYYNHYHCANLGLYSTKENEMNTIFFGGIAQYFDSMAILTQNNDVPFVRTIARVNRSSAGKMSEYKLPIEMPSLLGAGSEFIINESLPKFKNGVIKFDDLNSDTTLLGYIYGGISSTEPNIFFTNDGTQSEASKELFKVFLIKNNTSGVHHLNQQSVGTLKLNVFPNPIKGIFTIKYNLIKETDVNINITSIDGKVIEDKLIKNQSIGENTFIKYDMNYESFGTYILTIKTKYESAVQRIIIE